MLASKDGSDRTKVENLDQAMAEIERLRKDGEKLQGELTGNQQHFFQDCETEV